MPPTLGLTAIVGFTCACMVILGGSVIIHYTRQAAVSFLTRRRPPGARRLWVRDKRCGCAWTIDRPVKVRPCARHYAQRRDLLILKTYEVEMADLGARIRRALPRRRVRR